MTRRFLDIENLTRRERLDLIGQLWDSLIDEPGVVPLTEGQRAELDRRLDRLERDGAVGLPWDEVVRRVRGARD